ncbi:hypothetical protein D1007_48002 [Hordeum vulgare]|nr:hypothetical protein D1007_48002 [Hordeum vulgare]
MANRHRKLPDSLAIQLPPANDIKVVKITRLATVLDQMATLDPSPFSFDSNSDSNDPPGHRAHPFHGQHAPDEGLPRGPPSSPISTNAPPPRNHIAVSANMPIHISSSHDAPANQGHPIIISSDSGSAPPS